MLNISFKKRDLLNLCTRIDEAQARFGSQATAELFELLSEAESFATVADFLEFRGLKKPAEDSLSFRFGPQYELTFEALGDPPPRREDGRIAWNKVRRIMLIEINDDAR